VCGASRSGGRRDATCLIGSVAYTTLCNGVGPYLRYDDSDEPSFAMVMQRTEALMLCSGAP
jgi:hypothetical protein